MDELAGVAQATYRGLVWEDPAFPAFFRSFTPVDELALLEIGSRPASRPEAAATGELAGAARDPVGVRVDAEPLPAAGLVRLRRGLPRLRARGRAARLAPRASTREWPFFRALAREPRDDAREVELRDRRGLRRRSCPTRAEPERFWAALSVGARAHGGGSARRSSRRDELLDRHPVVQRSIRLRNPYVDPMNAIQVELLHAWRGGDEAARRPLLRSIAGIAAALRNTG